MPFTAFHVVPVWPIYVRWPHRWDLLALSFGAVMPDLEIILVYPITGDPALGRGIFHSILGTLTIDLFLALFTARILAPWVVAGLEHRFPGKGWRTFAHHEFLEDKQPWSVAVASAIVGGLSHLGLDLFHHQDTPLLWPWRDQPLHLGPWAPDFSSTIALNVVGGAFFLWMAAKWIGR